MKMKNNIVDEVMFFNRIDKICQYVVMDFQLLIALK